ncbi:M56 family metallopeptidase [Aequorivita xiaoshiensis]|uniref:M56 family metallopeptidase n=1 Tax=Aequorivita xiaoshiensis TaxID=2874476 RepID=A0A9X1QZH8_9FLAO|nr:M56 family metallopeptidase [Aequorivita xiaoshiensis]MCG2429544.1 M56 family metallopeptidase [Aequorivita xiaoshiensis]
MELFLLKSATILAVLFAFYKLFLENTSIHNFKRFYLWGSLLASLLIPLITFTTYVEASPIIPVSSEAASQINFTPAEQPIHNWPFVLWVIYMLGVLFFSVKFFRNFFCLIQKIRKNTKYKNNRFINILLNEKVIPHTFFNYIFLNKRQFENHQIPAEVMLHEETHARQKHSLDVIFIELLQIVFWFNPLFYFIKKSIKLNHEFLADRAVLNAGVETSNYQKILLAFSSPGSYRDDLTPSLAHSIKYLLIKKRFTIMKTHTSKRAVAWRSILLLPLLSILIYGFSTKEVLIEQVDNTGVFASDTIEDIRVVIDQNSKLTLNGIPVKLENLKTEINKRNTHLTAEQKQKYISGNVGFYTDKDKNLAEKIIEIFYASNIRKLSMSHLKNMEDANLDTNFIVNSYAGKTIEEAEVLHKVYLKDLKKSKAVRANVKNDKNNPWSIQVREPFERDVNTGKIIQQKATEAELAEYNKLAIKCNAVTIEKRIITKKDLERLETIYRKMSDAQKAKAQPFPECIPPPPPPPPAPKVKKGEKSDIPPPPPTPKAPSIENGNLYTAVQAPPPPNSNTAEYIKELAKKGATFYIGPHKYSADEAIELVTKNNEATIDVSNYPKVILGGC